MNALPHNYLEIPKEEADQLAANWQDAYSSDLSRIFSFQSSKGRQRYDTFIMSSTSVNKIINELDSPSLMSLANNVLNISVIMGVDEVNNVKTFSPILEVSLNIPVNGSDVYYFTFQAIDEPFIIPSEKVNHFLSGEISAEIAELFILNWQSLSEDAFVSAFETITTDTINYPDVQTETLPIETPPYIEFGSLKLYRVKSYQYSTEQTRTLINTLIDSLQNYTSTEFYFHAGHGLPNVNLHPFAFRPVLDVTSKGTSTDPNKVVNTYFDTSRPCPPFCPKVVIIPPSGQ